jgi:hypothetical protein
MVRCPVVRPLPQLVRRPHQDAGCGVCALCIASIGLPSVANAGDEARVAEVRHGMAWHAWSGSLYSTRPELGGQSGGGSDVGLLRPPVQVELTVHELGDDLLGSRVFRVC